MFKKPPSNIKTSAPLRSSDRRKLKQKVVAAFNISPEDGDLLVPDGLEYLKFSTHLEEPGVVYLAKNGDPLWFSVGKGSEDLVPTVYTLWKKADLLPFLSTPEAVIPVLTGGADLMIPGVVHHTRGLAAGQLVGIRKFSRKDGVPQLSVPLAVGRMALPSDQIESGQQEKGKAVHVLHAWKDHLWELGAKPEVPESEPIQAGGSGAQADDEEHEARTEGQLEVDEPGSVPGEIDQAQMADGTELTGPKEPVASYTPTEISELLEKSLLQAISTLLSSGPSSLFPMPATQFYTNYILPSRPAFPVYIQRPASLQESLSSGDISPSLIDPQEINIKASAHKSLTAFLKAAEKKGLINTKTPQKHSAQPDLLILSVSTKHPLVAGHTAYASLKAVEQTAAKKAEREEKAKEAEAKKELEVKELWKPHLVTSDLFKELGADPKVLYTPSEVRTILFEYVQAKDLINPNNKAYVNLDGVLAACLAVKPKAKGKAAEPEALADFVKRDDLVKRVLAKMQGWYEVVAPGKDPVQKKGILKPIQVVMKVRQGRKASTLITGYEPFLVVNGDEMAEDLRKICAGATSVSPIVGKPAGSGLEVLVQGKQSTAVLEYLMEKGIPKKWIEVSDLSGKK
ncbi:eukaryotic translation initiation factor SUI1 family protein [Coprinopsis sp. MPI-PUGE-AT-0042]|nr:eukaryotic translation initiation factor SUI1 family protein [Coprinopsis sp. MPI-PUGE-AT-0042]